MRKNIVLVCLTALVVAGAVPAVAAVKHLITGKQIKNHSVGGVDLKNRTITLKNLKKTTINSLRGTGQVGTPTTPGAQGEGGAPGAPGAPGANGANGSNGTNGTNGSNVAGITGPNWGVIYRNTIGSPVAELRNGPFTSSATADASADNPPVGQGSLGLAVSVVDPTVPATREKASFGNEVDFRGDNVEDLNAAGFYYFTTGENDSRQADHRNLPNIAFEIDPNLTANATNFSTLTWQPGPADTGRLDHWSTFQDATTNGDWVMSGAAGTATGCVLASPCTFQGMKTALREGAGPDATPAKILTANVTKGRDNAWQGAVDGLRINNEQFDFESYGVNTTTLP
jgi:hypothetical protein